MAAAVAGFSAMATARSSFPLALMPALTAPHRNPWGRAWLPAFDSLSMSFTLSSWMICGVFGAILVGETRAMLLKELRAAVLEANLELVKRGLVLYTFGNASGVDRTHGLVVIKPSGVDYDDLRPEHMVVTDLGGRIVDGSLKPSSDLDTHTLLYREFPTIGAVVHTHSEYATSFAQAGLAIPALGTTHADYFYGPVPCTEPLTDEAIAGRYVHETGRAIVNHFRQH